MADAGRRRAEAHLPPAWPPGPLLFCSLFRARSLSIFPSSTTCFISKHRHPPPTSVTLLPLHHPPAPLRHPRSYCSLPFSLPFSQGPAKSLLIFPLHPRHVGGTRPTVFIQRDLEQPLTSRSFLRARHLCATASCKASLLRPPPWFIDHRKSAQTLAVVTRQPRSPALSRNKSIRHHVWQA